METFKKVYNFWSKISGLLIFIILVSIIPALILAPRYNIIEFLIYNSFAFFCCFIGIIIYLDGFKYVRRKRLIENMPSSSISSLALGLVELSGTVEYAEEPLQSPFSDEKCVLYESNMNENKITLITSLFYLSDVTGRILVDPQGAEVVWKKEAVIKPGEQIFVLGTAQEYKSSERLIRESINKKLNELKTSPAALAQIDTDKDGRISDEEWDKAAKKVRENILAGNMGQLPSNSELILRKSDTDNVLIISAKSQQELNEILSKKSLFRFTSGLYIFTTSYLSILLGKLVYDKFIMGAGAIALYIILTLFLASIKKIDLNNV